MEGHPAQSTVDSSLKEKLKHWYEHKYKILIIFPILLLVLSLIQIGTQYAVTGDFVHKGITLKGGSTITVAKEIAVSPFELEQFLQQQFPTADITVRTVRSASQIVGVAIDSDAQEQEEIAALLTIIQQKLSLQKQDYSVEIVGSSLGESFFRQIIVALAVAFLLMSIVVFLYLRVPIPSLTVILCAFSDIVVTLAIFNLTGIKLSSAGVAAFLMLVGYSVDTDILLSVRVLKRQEGVLMERIYSSIDTGLTMTLTTISVVVVALLFVQSDVIKQIMIILFIGLLVDIIMTWIQNVAILKWYLERKKA